MDDNSFQFLQKYISTPSPVGNEFNAQLIWKNYIENFIDEFEVDNYGNAYAKIINNSQYNVVIEAHSDEISWFVNYIDEKGYIYVIRNGGSDPLISLSTRCNILTSSGTVKGVFGWPAIHVRKDISKGPEVFDLFLDVGANSRLEVMELGINIGDMVVPNAEVEYLNNGYIVGRAFDNKIGGYIIAQVLKKIKDNSIELDYNLICINSVQEEIGLKGAQIAAQKINPDIAVCIDVTHDTNAPGYDKKKQGDISCKKGPVIQFGPAIQNNVRKLLMDIASKSNIPYQLEANSRTTGTDTDSFAYYGKNTNAALISVPTKYIHTTVEMVHKDDVQACIDLYYEFLLNLKAGTDFRYIK